MLGTTAALLFAAAGCASLDPVASKAWSIEPVLDIQHSALAAHGNYAVGRYHDGMRAWGKAAVAYQRAVAADARHAEAHNGLGVALARLGRHEEAEAALRRAVEIEPQRAHLRSNLGFMMLKSGRLKEAVTELKAAVKLDPNDTTALANLREAVTRWEIAQGSESHAGAAGETHARAAGEERARAVEPAPAVATPAPAQAAAPQAVSAKPASAGLHAGATPAQLITVPAPLTTATVPVPVGGTIAVFDQPTVAAWPLGTGPGSFEAMASATAPISPARRDHAAASTGMPLAIAMPVHLSMLGMPVALAAPQGGGFERAAWNAGTRLELSNGNGVRGMAARLGKWLAHEGVQASRLTNSRPFAQAHTVVEYRSGQEAAAWQVLHALPMPTRQEPVLSPNLKSDVRVVLGLDWQSACLDPKACASGSTTIAAAVPRGE